MAQLEKAEFHNKLTGDIVKVMFNPAEVAVKKTIPWNQQSKPGKNQPKQHFTSGQARKVSMKLDFDTSGMDGDGPDATSVMDHVDPLLVLTNVPLDNEKAYPPLLDFMWGQGLKFVCVIASMNVTYTRFNTDGVPTRANVQLELLEVDEADYVEAQAEKNYNVTIREAPENEPIHNSSDDPEDWRNTANNNPDSMQNGNPRHGTGGPVQS